MQENPSTKFFNSIFDRTMFKENKNVIICTVGKTGSGKTYTNLRICEDWYRDRFKKDLPLMHICFSVREVLELLASGKVDTGDIILWEEAGKGMGSLDFQSKVAKVFNIVLQTYRKKRISLVTSLPYLSMLNKSTRMMINLLIRTIDIDKSTKEVITKPVWLSWDQWTGKCYKKRPIVIQDGIATKIDMMGIAMPSTKLLEEYEKKKDSFVNETIHEALAEVIRQDAKSAPKEDVFTENQIRVYLEWHKLKAQKGGQDPMIKELAPILGIAGPTLSEFCVRMNKRFPDWKNRADLLEIYSQKARKPVEQPYYNKYQPAQEELAKVD